MLFDLNCMERGVEKGEEERVMLGGAVGGETLI